MNGGRRETVRKEGRRKGEVKQRREGGRDELREGGREGKREGRKGKLAIPKEWKWLDS